MLYRVIQTKLLQEPVLAQCGGGVGPLMANAILNFHFDYLNPSLRTFQEEQLEEQLGYLNFSLYLVIFRAEK